MKIHVAAAGLCVFAACGDSKEPGSQGGGGTAPSAATGASSAGGATGGKPLRCSVDDGSPEHLVALEAGKKSSLALTSRGRVACWGDASYGECGPEPLQAYVVNPVWIPGIDCVKQVDTNLIGFALDDEGSVFAWGTEFQGELGDGPGVQSSFASVVRVHLAEAADDVVSERQGGKAHVRDETMLWGLVWNEGTWHEPSVWELAPGAQVFRSGGAIFELDVSGGSRGRGGNTRGELGDGTLEQRSHFVSLATNARFASLQLGTTCTCGITLGGDVYCWGDSRKGQLGIGVLPPLTAPIEERAVPVPTKLEALADIVMMDLAEAGGCALDGAGDVYCWGENRYKRFVSDLEDVDAVVSPTRIADLSPARTVALGDDHVCVLRLDDTVWCRGAAYSRGFNGAAPEEATQMDFALEEGP